MTAEKLSSLRARINVDIVTILIIDEVSYLGPGMLAQVDLLISQIIESKTGDPFGGLFVILMGDFLAQVDFLISQIIESD